MIREISPYYITKDKILEFGKDKAKHTKRGCMYAKSNLWEEAAEQWREAIEIDPNNASAHNNLGVYYEKIGLLKKALEEYKKALSINPESKLYMQNVREIREEITHRKRIKKRNPDLRE